MKLYPQLFTVFAFATLLTLSTTAQTVLKETTTTTSAGTVSEFTPETIIIKSETVTEPVRYYYTKKTTYVDEAGTPVSVDIVKSGLPVTVYYTQEGDRMVVSKVIVKKVVEPTAVEKKTTTTTTTTEK